LQSKIFVRRQIGTPASAQGATAKFEAAASDAATAERGLSAGFQVALPGLFR